MDSFKQRLSREIRSLLASINDDNCDAVIGELSAYIEHGTEESILLVETCLDHFKIYEKDLKSMNLEPVVASLFRKLMEKPHFSAVFSRIMRYTTISEEFLDNLSNTLKLSAYEKLGFGLALSDSEVNDVRMAGRNFCMVQFAKLLATCSSLDPLYCIKDALGFLEQLEVLSEHVDSYIQMFLHLFLNAHSDQLHDSKNLRIFSHTDYQCAPQSKELIAPFRIFVARMLGSQNQLAHPCRTLRPRGIQLLNEAAISLLMSCYRNACQQEVPSAVLPMLLKDASMSGILLQLWHANPRFFVRALSNAFNLAPDSMNRVVDLLQDLKILLPLLDLVPMSLGIKLVALASQKEFIDLEEWLSINLNKFEDIFFEECLRFLKEVEAYAQKTSDYGQIWSLYKATTPTFLKVLPLHIGLLSSKELSEEMKSVCVTYIHHSPGMKNIDGSASSTSDVYADNIGTEVNFYFQQMFCGQLTGDALVQMLTQFKGSSEQREQAVFECMIKNLFEVYKFLDRYSDDQLTISAVLSGLLIRHQVLTHPTLDIALQAVLDALHEPADSKMFVLGTKVLENFVDRLNEWPEYCQKILQISHLRITQSKLVSVIEQTLARTSTGHPKSDEGHIHGTEQHHGSAPKANVEIPASSSPLTGADGAWLDSQVFSLIQLHESNKSHKDERDKASLTSSNHMNRHSSTSGKFSVATSSGSVRIQKPQSVVRSSSSMVTSPDFSSPSRKITPARFGSALRIGTLLKAAERREMPIEAPPSATQDNIYFIINNVSAANIEAKVKEFIEIVEEQYYPWFAQYMVMKRVSIEPNFHMLYLSLLEKVNSKHLNDEIVRETYESCKVLLRSELIKSSSEERSLLKNLGSWLGKITIGRNRVLLSREIDPKSLIMEAYEKGLMIGVIPFISKILESCQRSLAYQPPNPWTMGILGLLAEIHAMPNLKANLKFEIEVLFRNLNLDLKSVTLTSLLKDKVRQAEGNPDFSIKDVGSSQQQIVKVNSTVRCVVSEAELPPEALSYQGGHSQISNQHADPLHRLAEDDEMETLGLSNQLPLIQGRALTQFPFPNIQLPSPTPNLLQHVNPNHKLEPFLHLQSVLPLAMDKAVKETVSNISQKSASIATQTTIELLFKECDTELDENLIHKASRVMVVQLAGNLAYVTSKEPLRHLISTQLRNLLQGLDFASEFLDNAIQLLVDNNLDLGCASVKKAATDKGLMIVEKELAQKLSDRRKHREAFYLKSGLLSHPQQQLNEHYVLLPGQHSSQHSNTIISDSSPRFGNEGALPSFPSVLASPLKSPNVANLTNHPSSSKDDNIASEYHEPDPPGFRGQVSMLLAEWSRIHELPGAHDYVGRLHQHMLTSDDMTERFLRVLLELVVSNCVPFEGSNSSSFHVIDLYADLVFSILKFSPVYQGSNKISFLSKVLVVIVKLIKKDAQEKKTLLDPRPYFKLFINFLLPCSTPDSIIVDANFQVLTLLSTCFHALQPMKVPSFSFAWLELISHKDFMPNLLTANACQGWPYFERLLIDLLQFMEPFLRSGALEEPVRQLYKGTIRVLLLVLHDYPQFLCYNYFSFCDVIPPRCIQLRNIILSAFPPNTRLPDPNTPNLKVDLLHEMSQPPYILSPIDAALRANNMKSDIDEYLMVKPEGSLFLSTLKHKLLLPPREAERRGTCYNVPLMNSLVLYVGTQAIQQLQASLASHATSIARCVTLSNFFASAGLEIFRTLIQELDSEGWYHLLNAVADHLRYPNSHTHFFSFIMLYLFDAFNQEAIREVITRVLLERLMSQFPHPWGVLVTFIELVKNPKYNFWRQSFTRCAPEIQRIFDSVSTSCGIERPKG